MFQATRDVRADSESVEVFLATKDMPPWFLQNLERMFPCSPCFAQQILECRVAPVREAKTEMRFP